MKVAPGCCRDIPGPVARSKGIESSMDESTPVNITPAWDDSCMTRHYLGIAEIAEHVGLERETVKAYVREGRLPAPDVAVGKIRGWSEKTIDKWWESRPGRGARTDLAKPKRRSGK